MNARCTTTEGATTGQDTGALTCDSRVRSGLSGRRSGGASRRELVGVALVGLIVSLAAAARGAGPSSNLLDHREPSLFYGVFRPDRLTDGEVLHEGAPVQSPWLAVFGVPNSVAVWDLGSPQRLAQAFLQAGPENELLVEASADGHDFVPLWRVPSVPGASGMVTRRSPELSGTARFIRLTVSRLGDFAPVGEVALFANPTQGPNWRVRAGEPPLSQADLARQQLTRKLVIALLALVSTLAFLKLERLGLALAAVSATAAAAWTFGFWVALLPAGAGVILLVRASKQVGRSAGYLLQSMAAVLAFVNFGSFLGHHGPHYHDLAHYFLGAKYATELSYQRLYLCAGLVQVESPVWPADPGRRSVRDLSTGTIGLLDKVAPDRRGCLDHFTPARWEAFRHDVRFFMAQLTPAAWAQFLTDHGYNASPVLSWLLRMFVVRDQAATVPIVSRMIRVDEGMLILLGVVALAGFGLETGALALSLCALGYPWIFLWTGGSIGRALWLTGTVAGLGLLARGRPRGAGLLVGVAAAAQVFPIFLLVGPGIALAAGKLRRRLLNPQASRFVVWAVAGILLLVGASGAALGPASWSAFLRNSQTHVSTVSTNGIGLPVLVRASARPIASPAPDDGILPTPGRSVLCFLALVGLVALFIRATMRGEPPVVETAALSLLLVPAAVALSSYYFVMLMGLAPVLVRRSRRVAAALIFVIATLLLGYLETGQPGAGYYAAVSALLLVLSVFVMADVAYGKSSSEGQSQFSTAGVMP